jgi:hypothetical protein
MQLVGEACIHCRERISRESDGFFCRRCGCPVHSRCAAESLQATPEGGCRACGAPRAILEQLKEAEARRDRDADARQQLQTVMTGVALLGAGLAVTICCSGYLLAVRGEFLVASGALVGGVGFIVAGLLRARRR